MSRAGSFKLFEKDIHALDARCPRSTRRNRSRISPGRLSVPHAIARLRPGGSLFLYTGVAMTSAEGTFLAEIAPLLNSACSTWLFEEIDRDGFGDEVAAPECEDIERIRVVWLHAVKRHLPSKGAE